MHVCRKIPYTTAKSFGCLHSCVNTNLGRSTALLQSLQLLLPFTTKLVLSEAAAGWQFVFASAVSSASAALGPVLHPPSFTGCPGLLSLKFAILSRQAGCILPNGLSTIPSGKVCMAAASDPNLPVRLDNELITG